MAYISQIKLGPTTYDISAYKLKNARTINLTGAITGSASFDGTTDISINTVLSGSHTHDQYLPLTAGQDKKLTGPLGLTENINYGPDLPSTNTFDGQLFFLEDSGAILPPGGAEGQVLVKASSLDNDATWTTDIMGNAATATKLATARTISLTGSVTGSGTFDGSGNLSITTTANHSHSYLPLNGGTMDNEARISHGGNLYIGTTNNTGWIGFQDICSQESLGDGKWSIRTNGNAIFQTCKGAVWNDYAEFRICSKKFKPGQVVLEKGDDTLSIANQRLQRGCSIVSDTFGFAIGETDEAKCPIAVSGRVLAYGYESREEFKKHIGWPVCSGPNGTVSIMTEEEEEKYPSRIIGTISAVPDYETWGTGNVEVNNRIWIKVK